jgi:hypothetical protein
VKITIVVFVEITALLFVLLILLVALRPRPWLGWIERMRTRPHRRNQ